VNIIRWHCSCKGFLFKHFLQMNFVWKRWSFERRTCWKIITTNHVMSSSIFHCYEILQEALLRHRNIIVVIIICLSWKINSNKNLRKQITEYKKLPGSFETLSAFVAKHVLFWASAHVQTFVSPFVDDAKVYGTYFTFCKWLRRWILNDEPIFDFPFDSFLHNMVI